MAEKSASGGGIELSAVAAEEVRKLAAAEGLGADVCLRVGVQGQGPRRTFRLDLEGPAAEHDRVTASQGIRLAWRSCDLPQLAGVTIDFRDVGGGVRGFVFDTPKSERGGAQSNTTADPSAAPPDEQRVRHALRDVVDPEVGINIVDLGLVYGVIVDGRAVRVTMTMTTPACPLGEQIKRDVVARVGAACPGAESVEVEVVWEPRWSSDLISAEAKRALGW